MKMVCSKEVSIGNGDCQNLISYSHPPSPIFLNENFHDMICLVNTDVMFTFNNVNVEELIEFIARRNCSVKIIKILLSRK